MENSIYCRSAIDQISQYRISSICKMDSDLMHPPCLYLHFDQRTLSQDGMNNKLIQPAFCFCCNPISHIYLHMGPIKTFIITFFQRFIYHQVMRKMTSNQGQIIFIYLSLSNNFIDILESIIGFTSDQYTRSIFIQSISK